MERYYTEAVRESFFDMIENNTTEMWKNLDRSASMILSGKWKNHYEEIVSKYRFSSRFAIMRILFEKETGLSPTKIDERVLAQGFSVAGIGEFPNITIKHAKDMPATEVDLYRKILLHRVEESNPSYCAEAVDLVNGILELPPAGTKCKLSRDQIIRLGHMVDFSLEDVQFLLLRVLGDNEASFNPSAAMDVVDIYGFISHSSLSQVDELKEWYGQNTANIEKVEYADKPVQFTQNVANSLEQLFTRWSHDDSVNEFKSWLLQNAPYFDLKSKTARKVYINLAAYAYIQIKKIHSDMGDIVGETLYGDMEDLSQVPDYHKYAVQLFFKGSKPDAEKCESIAEELIYENAEYAGGFNIHDNNSELLYHVPHVENGKITSRGKLNKNSKKRIRDILMDEVAPTKSDLLYLLWFIANCQWIGITGSADEKVQFMDEFLASAACILEAALLPEFYPPNILEETLMLALALGDDAQTPAMIYESICSVFTDKGKAKKKAGTTKKSPEQKREIAAYYYSHLSEYPNKTACKKACADHFGIGVASVEGYCREYPEDKV